MLQGWGILVFSPNKWINHQNDRIPQRCNIKDGKNFYNLLSMCPGNSLLLLILLKIEKWGGGGGVRKQFNQAQRQMKSRWAAIIIRPDIPYVASIPLSPSPRNRDLQRRPGQLYAFQRNRILDVYRGYIPWHSTLLAGMRITGGEEGDGEVQGEGLYRSATSEDFPATRDEQHKAGEE